MSRADKIAVSLGRNGQPVSQLTATSPSRHTEALVFVGALRPEAGPGSLWTDLPASVATIGAALVSGISFLWLL